MFVKPANVFRDNDSRHKGVHGNDNCNNKMGKIYKFSFYSQNNPHGVGAITYRLQAVFKVMCVTAPTGAVFKIMCVTALQGQCSVVCVTMGQCS